MTIKIDRIERIVLAKTVGRSAKYTYFLAQHMRAGGNCFDVCALNNLNGEMIVRHHHLKEEALVTWEHINRELERISQLPEEKDEQDVITI